MEDYESQLSEEQKRRLQETKQQWADARAAGDAAAEKAAHEAAEAIRAEAGFSGGADGSGYIKLDNGTQDQQTKPAGMTAEEVNRADPQDPLSRMIDDAKVQTDSMTAPALQTDLQVDSDMPGSARQDRAYLTAISDLGEGDERKGAYVADGAGEIYRDNFGQEWMRGRDGVHDSNITGMSEEERAAAAAKEADDSYQLTGRVYGLDANGNTPQWLSVGDQVVTGGGTYVITGHKQGGGYYSELLDPAKTTANYKGEYDTGTYGSILGEQNGYVDRFRGNRDTWEHNMAGSYSQNKATGKMQYDTNAYGYDGELIRAAVQDGKAYKLDTWTGKTEELDAGTLVQDASGRSWVVTADGGVRDVTNGNPNMFEGDDPAVRAIMRDEAQKAGVIARKEAEKRAEEEEIRRELLRAQNAPYEAEIARQNQITADANRDLYIDYRQGQRQLGDSLARGGLSTTGDAQRVQGELTADWMNAMAKNEMAAQSAENDIRARAIEAQRQLTEQQDARTKAEAEQKAATMAQYGDFSGYGNIGYTPEEVGRMQSYYDQQTAQQYDGLSSYAKTLLNLYQSNPAYNLQGGAQEALDAGLISAQDYTAVLMAAKGIGR